MLHLRLGDKLTNRNLVNKEWNIILGGSTMTDKIKEISSWLLNQGVEITRDVLEEKLQEAYKQGQIDTYHEQVQATLDNILFNTMQNIKLKKKELYENNFYNIPSDEDIIKMRAYEYLSENLNEIIKQYKES
jgi:hypothetical protein